MQDVVFVFIAVGFNRQINIPKRFWALALYILILVLG